MAVVFKAGNTDVRSDVLGTLRLRGQVFCVSEFSSPWSMRLAPADRAHFHVVERGEAWLRLPRERRPIPLRTGDLVVLPRGSGHILSDGTSTPPVPLADLLARGALRKGVLRHGGDGARTHLICGAFEFESAADDPIVSLLPPVIQIPADTAGAWLKPTLDLLAREARRGEQGSTVLITRLTEIVFVQAVRVWVAEQPVGRGGWLGALRDGKIAAALALVHHAPERGWRVGALAGGVGMSRSPFAARVRALVGVPPLEYVRRWRLHLAMTLLRNQQLAVATVAEHVGYESEAAFSKAFKRHLGVPPSQYRRTASARQRSGSPAAS
jgi:AraC-like DNA-binding protein